MSALSDENPTYTISYEVPATGRRKEHTVRRDDLRRTLRTYTDMIRDRTILDVKVINRFGEDVTVDWFG